MGICWYKDIVIVTNHNQSNQTFEVLKFFDSFHFIFFSDVTLNVYLDLSDVHDEEVIFFYLFFFLKVRFYYRTRLSNSALLFKSVLPQKKRPLYIDCNDTFLVLFTVDSFFYQYSIITTGEKGSDKEQELKFII